MREKKAIAIFDFDGTLTKGDTFLPFLYHSFGRWKTMYGLLYNFPFIIAYLLKFVSNEYAKTKIINFFFKNKNVEAIRGYSQNFISEKLEYLLRENVVKRLKWHQNMNHITVLISASLDVYVKPWAKKFSFSYIESTELQVLNQMYTGRLNGKNCYGLEKVNRLNKIFMDDLKDYELYGYGDSKGDDFFLEICDHKFHKKDLYSL